MSNPEHISTILARHWLFKPNDRSKIDPMQTLTIPRKLSIDFINGDQAHCFEVDVTELNREEIQTACGEIVDAMLIDAGMVEG